MSQTSREVVQRCLRFENPERIPVDMWVLPWAETRFPDVLQRVREKHPSDFTFAPDIYNPSSKRQGDAFVVGTYVDEWGCVFENLHDGVIGEVKNPVIDDAADLAACVPPYELLPTNPGKARDIVNRACGETDKFVFASCLPRPWERYQFLRGTEEAMVDTMMPEEGGDKILKKIHDFYMKELEFWASTNVDAIFFMDDWGSQSQLLISPSSWREQYKPLYKDYCDIAHSNGKFAFMHSDGNISEIYEDLVEVGVDAQNSQLFVMDMADLAKRVKGKITFWGEIDRQHVFLSDDPQVVKDAVRKVAKNLYDPAGGIIAQFEVGPGANPENAMVALDEWAAVHDESTSKYA